jgi:hypothetical protein
VPRWILPSHLEESSATGLPTVSRQASHAHFLEAIGCLDRSGEWGLAYTKGRPFRLLVDRLPFQMCVWADESVERWVDDRLSWAGMHPGVGFPDDSVVVAERDSITTGLISSAS